MTRRPAGKIAARSRPVKGSPKAARGKVREKPSTAVPVAADAAEPAGNRPAIRVEIASAVEGWPVRSRFDVVLRGQITSASPVDSFTIRDSAGLSLATVEFGHGDEQPTVTLPGGGVAFRIGFQVYVPMPAGATIRVADLWVGARSRDGAIFEEAMRLGCMADQAAILAGPLYDGVPGEEIPAPRGIVYLESAEIGAGGSLLVHGWTLATSPFVAVLVFVDGTRAGAAVLGRERDDVARAYPSWPNSGHAGFSLVTQVDAAMRGATRVTAQVLCLSGACHAATVPLVFAAAPPAVAASPEPALIASRPSGPATSRKRAKRGARAAPEGASPAAESESSAAEAQGSRADLVRTILLICDQAVITPSGALLVSGWAACGNGIDRVEVEIDGRPEGQAEYGRGRPDVAAEYHGIPVNTGFGFERTIPGLAGASHEVRVIAVSHAGDRKELVVIVEPPAAAAFRFELDGPATRDGAAVDPVTGRLVIEGWALARDGMASIDVELDGALLGQAHYGTARPDVGIAFPDWAGAARGGYIFHCPSRSLPDGEHTIQIIARSKTGGSHVHAFRITVRKTDDPEATSSIRRRIKRVEQTILNGVLDELNWRPGFHLFVTGDPAWIDPAWIDPVGDGSGSDGEAAAEKALATTIRSILEQSWTGWRVTMLASCAAEAESMRASIARQAVARADRFNVMDASAEAWEAPLACAADASLAAILSAGDELGRDALGRFRRRQRSPPAR